MSKVEEFREAINANEEWQEEVKNFGADDNIVNYASGKGYEFTNDEYSEYVEENASGELSEFEATLVSGGVNFIHGAFLPREFKEPFESIKMT